MDHSCHFHLLICQFPVNSLNSVECDLHYPPSIHLIVQFQYICTVNLYLHGKGLYQFEDSVHIQFLLPLVSQTLHLSKVT